MNNPKKVLRNQEGFTLIELIAVMVILGILAAVAVPRYMDMQSQARYNAAQSALGSAAANVSLAYSQCLVNNTTPTGISGAGVFTGCTAASVATGVGDFTVSYANGTWPTVSISLAYGTPAWLTATNLPGTSATRSVILQ